MEVYVDDILIKSLRDADLYADIEETCQMLRAYEIKLNPSKCFFGGKGEKFLGYIVTERGIEANPSKVRALQDMSPPRSLKEAQHLTGHITALSQFISKSVDWSLPLLKILCRATKFQWDEECDHAFEELKAYLNSLPVLAKPTAGEPLRIYLPSIEHDVGSTLVSLVAHIDRMEELTFPNHWRTPLIEFLRSGTTLSNQEEVHLLRRRAGRFMLIGDQLYKKAFSRPLLKCVGPEDIDYILREVHQGTCGGHPGGRSLARKILLVGYFWPTLQADAAQTMSTYLSYQKYHSLSHRTTEEMKAAIVFCPLDQGGMDIVGSFPMATGQRKFLLVAVNYFFKWVEVEPLVRITEQMAIRTIPKEGTGVISFHLVYGGEAVVPVEVGVESDQVQQYSEDNAEQRLLELDLVDEARGKGAVRLTTYRQRMR
ncbi:uncharacterized protein LOC121991009 [Zingiber officinale]|uniref:uncharacterized protein LOC121991009 n=1 Tax=Zingiber officinale TaxID=94328 RepID=UPI001C4D76C9|nr:uncharacterized protein LOC121991009 [Zingiber officinale]